MIKVLVDPALTLLLKIYFLFLFMQISFIYTCGEMKNDTNIIFSCYFVFHFNSYTFVASRYKLKDFSQQGYKPKIF